MFKKEYSLSLQEVADSIVKIIETKVRSNKSINVLLPSHYALLSINGDTLENYERLLEYDFLNQTVRVAFRISRLSDGMNLLQSHSFSFDFDEENREQIDNDATDDAQIIINNTAHSLLIYGIGIGSKQSASDEFVILYNNSEEPLNPAGVKIKYASATAASSSIKCTIPEQSIIIGGREFLLVAGKNFPWIHGRDNFPILSR